jgi:hypothetical protein
VSDTFSSRSRPGAVRGAELQQPPSAHLSCDAAGGFGLTRDCTPLPPAPLSPAGYCNPPGTCNSVKSACVQCRAPKNGRIADSVEETEQFCSDSPCRPAYDFRERSRGSQGALERNLSVRPEQTVWPPLSRNRAKLSDRHLLARLRRIGLQVTGRPRRSTASAGRIDRGKSRSDSSGVPRAQVSAQARTQTFLSPLLSTLMGLIRTSAPAIAQRSARAARRASIAAAHAAAVVDG